MQGTYQFDDNGSDLFTSQEFLKDGHPLSAQAPPMVGGARGGASLGLVS